MKAIIVATMLAVLMLQVSGAAAAPQLVSKTADSLFNFEWDPKGDDPRTVLEDGKPHPEEAAIRDPKASPSEKAQAWERREARLFESKSDMSPFTAKEHTEYWEHRRDHPEKYGD